MILRATTADAGGAAALFRAVAPESLSTAAGIAHNMTVTPPAARALRLKVERDRTLVGWGWAMLDWTSTTPADARAGIVVAPAHRREGLGAALWSALDRHLDAIGATVVRSRGDDETTRGFAEPRGFRQTATMTILSLDPATVDRPGAMPPGVSVDPFTAFARAREQLYAVDVATMQDEPGDHDFGGMTFEDWLRDTYDHPDFDPEISGVVCVDGEPAGMSLVYSDREAGRAVNGGTGVLAAHRGQGLGRLLKRATLRRAREAGIERVFTTNDETNAPMLAINRQLGYVPFATRTTWRRG